MTEDPQLESPATLRLQPTSPAIDAGTPGASCGLEPAPNGCAVNLGAYGDTPDAASAPGAEDCGATCPD